MRSKDTKKHEETEFLACHGHFLFGQHKPTSIFDGKYNISSRLRMKLLKYQVLNKLFSVLWNYKSECQKMEVHDDKTHSMRHHLFM